MLDLDKAFSSSLQKITEIELILADQIVKYRKTSWHFYSIDELLNNEGVGPTRFSFFKNCYTVSYKEKIKNILKSVTSDNNLNLNFANESKKGQHSTKIESAKETKVKHDVNENLQIKVNSKPDLKFTFGMDRLQIFFVIFSLTWNIIY